MNSKPDLFSKTFCALAWEQIHVTPTGVVKPCCIYEDAIKNEKGDNFRITDDRIENIWNSTNFKELRLKMLNGESIPGCLKCYNEEKFSQSSERIKYLSGSDRLMESVNQSQLNGGEVKNFPHMINLKIGNTCNLKCRMCQPLDSSLIDNEFIKISEKSSSFRNFDNASAFDYNFEETPIELLEDWILNPQALKNIKKIINNVTYFALAGGEIAITPEVINFLKFCIDEGYSKNISLFVSTNLTKVTDEFIKILASFKISIVLASIDGTENVLEYIRFPSRWDIIHTNFKKLINAPENVIPTLAPTVQIYNVLDIVDVFKLIDGLYTKKWEIIEPYQIQPCQLTILFSPEHLSIRHLPKAIKDIAYQRIKKYYNESPMVKKHSFFQLQLELLMETLQEENYDAGQGITSGAYLSHFMQYTKDLDEARHQRMQDYLPELYELLKKENIVPQYPREAEISFSFYKYRDNGFKLYSQGKLEEAIFSFERAYNLNKVDPDLLFSLGIAYKKNNETDRGNELFEKLYKIDPNHYYNLMQLAISRIDRLNYREAFEYLEKAKKYRPIHESELVEELLELCTKNMS